MLLKIIACSVLAVACPATVPDTIPSAARDIFLSERDQFIAQRSAFIDEATTAHSGDGGQSIRA